MTMATVANGNVDKWVEISQQCKVRLWQIKFVTCLQYLPENELKQLCDIVCDLLLEESNVQPGASTLTTAAATPPSAAAAATPPSAAAALNTSPPIPSVHPCDCMWWYPWSVLWPWRTFQVTSPANHLKSPSLPRCGGPPPDTNYIFMGDFVDRGWVELCGPLLSTVVTSPSNPTTSLSNLS